MSTQMQRLHYEFSVRLCICVFVYLCAVCRSDWLASYDSACCVCVFVEFVALLSFTRLCCVLDLKVKREDNSSEIKKD